MPEITDEELNQLKAQAAEAQKAKDLEGKLQAEQAARENDRAVFKGFVDSWQQAQQAQLQNQPVQPQPTPEDFNAPVGELTKGQLANILAEAQRSGLAPVYQTYYQQQAITHRKLTAADSTNFPNFKKWEKEIEALVAAQPPQIQADPNAWSAAYQAVRAQHIDEEVEDRIRARATRPTEGDEGSEDDGGSEDTETPPTPTHAARPTPTGGSPAISTSHGGGKKKITLTPKEKQFADMFNLDPAEYKDRQLGPGEGWTEDVLGFTDKKTGRVRQTV